MHEEPILVISSGARDLASSATCEEKISCLWLEMTTATQSQRGKEGDLKNLGALRALREIQFSDPSSSQISELRNPTEKISGAN
jgi:hypothetical protein